MDQRKIGAFLKRLRNEKGITQEAFAEKLNVSSRTVSRWETGSNLPDISLLVEIAKFFDVDVREIIDGGKKGEMNEETKEVADKMVDYAGNEKRKMIKWIQVVGFAGIFLLTLAIIFWRRNDYYHWGRDLYDAVLIVMGIAFALFVIITMYVVHVLERIRKPKMMVRVLKRVAVLLAGIITVLVIVLPRFGINIFRIGMNCPAGAKLVATDGYYLVVWPTEETVAFVPYKRFLCFSELSLESRKEYTLYNKDKTEILGTMLVISTPSGKLYYCYHRDFIPNKSIPASPHVYDEFLSFSYKGKEIKMEGDYWFSSDVDFRTADFSIDYNVLYLSGEPCRFGP